MREDGGTALIFVKPPSAARPREPFVPPAASSRFRRDH
jgi:hypothetical protein